MANATGAIGRPGAVGPLITFVRKYLRCPAQRLRFSVEEIVHVTKNIDPGRVALAVANGHQR